MRVLVQIHSGKRWQLSHFSTEIEQQIYTLIVARALWTAFLLGAVLFAQEPPAPQQGPRPQDLPEEDESLKPKEYALNPIESARNINVGNQYFKKGNYRAAANRFKEASLWDPGNAEAFLRLGEALERAHDLAPAREAYAKYLELAKDSKDADAIKKRIAKLPGASAREASK
jgi:tetratricopeptide (TPR) repeat protein